MKRTQKIKTYTKEHKYIGTKLSSYISSTKNAEAMDHGEFEDIARAYLSEWFASIGHDVVAPVEFRFVRVKLRG